MAPMKRRKERFGQHGARAPSSSFFFSFSLPSPPPRRRHLFSFTTGTCTLAYRRETLANVRAAENLHVAGRSKATSGTASGTHR